MNGFAADYLTTGTPGWADDRLTPLDLEDRFCYRIYGRQKGGASTWVMLEYSVSPEGAALHLKAVLRRDDWVYNEFCVYHTLTDTLGRTVEDEAKTCTFCHGTKVQKTPSGPVGDCAFCGGCGYAHPEHTSLIAEVINRLPVGWVMDGAECRMSLLCFRTPSGKHLTLNAEKFTQGEALAAMLHEMDLVERTQAALRLALRAMDTGTLVDLDAASKAAEEVLP